MGPSYSYLQLLSLSSTLLPTLPTSQMAPGSLHVAQTTESISDPSGPGVLCSLSPLPLTRRCCAILGIAYGRGMIWPICEEEAPHAARNLMARKQVSDVGRTVRSCNSLLRCGSAIVDALRRFSSTFHNAVRSGRPYVVFRERNDVQFPRYLRAPRDLGGPSKVRAYVVRGVFTELRAPAGADRLSLCVE